MQCNENMFCCLVTLSGGMCRAWSDCYDCSWTSWLIHVVSILMTASRILNIFYFYCSTCQIFKEYFYTKESIFHLVTRCITHRFPKIHFPPQHSAGHPCIFYNINNQNRITILSSPSLPELSTGQPHHPWCECSVSPHSTVHCSTGHDHNHWLIKTFRCITSVGV